MPIYAYSCQSCGKQFERVVRLSEADLPQECPECRSANTKKKISAFASIGGSSGGSTASGCGSSGGRFT
jgi:putative FmdB family regulatory protein